MPKRISTDQAERLKADSSFVFTGTPVENYDVEKELESKTKDMGVRYDAHILADALVKIGENMVGVSLYDYQREPAFRIIYSLLVKDGAEITLLYPRQSGKSEVVSFTVNVIGVLFPVLAKIYPKELGHFKSGVKMGLLAPQMDQVNTVYERCMERLLSPSVRMYLDDPEINDSPMSTVQFKLKSGTFLKGQSAAKQSRVESKTYHIIFLDEAQDLDIDKVRRSIIPMAAATFGTIIRTGTPGRVKGDFYHKIKQNDSKDKKLRSVRERLQKQLHFEYDYKTVVKQKNAQAKIDGMEFHTLYEKAVNRDLESWGAGSDAFRMAYKVEWLLEIGMFITDTDLEKKVYNGRIGFPDIQKADYVVAGLDIASARANTVLTFGIVDDPAMELGDRPRKTVAEWVKMEHTNYDDQFTVVAEELLANRTKVVYVDYTGVGRMFGDMLFQHLGEYMEVVLYTFSEESKSDMYKRLDEDIDNDHIIVPAHKTQVRQTDEWKCFHEQMTNLTKSWKGNSRMICQKSQGYLDDFPDSLALMNMAGNHVYNPLQVVEVSENLFFNSGRSSRARNSRW